MNDLGKVEHKPIHMESNTCTVASPLSIQIIQQPHIQSMITNDDQL